MPTKQPADPVEPTLLSLTGDTACQLVGQTATCWSIRYDDKSASRRVRLDFVGDKVHSLSVSDRQVCTTDNDAVRCWSRPRLTAQPPFESNEWEPSLSIPLQAPRRVRTGGLGNVVCASNEAGELWCFGFDRDQPRDGLRVATNVRDFAVTWSSACWVDAQQRVACFDTDGYEYFREEGELLDPEYVESVGEVAQLEIAPDRSCARREDGTVQCWGSAYAGALGDGDQSYDARGPVSVVGITDAIDLSMSRDHACVVRADGTVWCWGYNKDGALGPGAGAIAFAPVKVPKVENAVNVVTSEGLTCATDSRGATQCWGTASNVVRAPVRPDKEKVLAAGSRGIELVGSFAALCSRGADDNYLCFGDPGHEQSAYERQHWWAPPFPELVAHDSYCGLTPAGAVQCWHQPLERAAHGTVIVPDAVSFSSNQIGCAARDSGAVRCWQWSAGSPPIVSDVGAYTDAIDVAVNFRTACVLRRSGSAECFDAQALPRAASYQPPVKPLVGLTDGVQLLSAGALMCARMGPTGKLGCWDEEHLDMPPTMLSWEGTTLQAKTHLLCSLHNDGRLGCWRVRKSATALPPEPDFALPGPHAQATVSDLAVCVRAPNGDVRCPFPPQTLLMRSPLWPPAPLRAPDAD